MKSERKRFLIGGLCGVSVMFLCALYLEFVGAQLRGTFHIPVLVTHGAEVRFGSYLLAVVVQASLCFGLGGMIGLATMPFDEDGRKLLVNSLLHFSVTALLFSLLLVLCFGLPVWSLVVWVGMLLSLYLVIWLGRYVGWYVEVAQIRSKLGLAPGPSVLNWRETLLYLPFLLLLCVGLPLLARLLDPTDVPVLSGILLPYLLLPAGGFFSGFSLGKRQGLCPLYPVLAFVLYLPIVFLLFNSSAMFHCFVAAGFTLAGNLFGTFLRRRKRG